MPRTTNKIQWKRLLAEGGAIVLSILLAFAIDAAWEERQAGRIELAALRAVSEELGRNRAELDNRQELLEAGRDRTVRFLTAESDQLVDLPSDSVALWVMGMARPLTFDPEITAASLLLQMPLLTSERGVAARTSVARWIAELEDADEEGQATRDLVMIVREHLSLYTVAEAKNGLSPLYDMVAQVGPHVLVRLRDDSVFVASLLDKTHHQVQYMSELDGAGAVLDSLVSQLSDISPN